MPLGVNKQNRIRLTLALFFIFFSGGFALEQQYSGSNRGLFSKIFFAFSLLGVCVAVVLVLFFLRKGKDMPNLNEIYKDWESSSYNSVYLKTEQILKHDPFNPQALAFRGFSSYYIYISEPDVASNLVYLENAIISLRQAFYLLHDKDIEKVSYILGKAYFQKGEYYADLAIKYLSMAQGSASFSDLEEFKGMAHLNLGELEAAISSFTLALKDSPSPFLLYILGETYMKLEDFQNAKQYFFQTMNETKDELLQIKCRTYIGTILFNEGEIEKAKSEFMAILEKDAFSSEAHYVLGLILEKEGDMVKARSEWRRALKSNPSHEKAIEKLKV